jgi:hypothetical protein
MGQRELVALRSTPDGSVLELMYDYVSGTTVLVKLDVNGTPLWQRTIAGPASVFPGDIAATSDNGAVVLIGWSSLLVCFDSGGSVVWTRALTNVAARSLSVTPSDEIVVVGLYSPPGEGSRPFVAKLTSAGAISAAFHIPPNPDVEFNSPFGFWDACGTADGGFAVAGSFDDAQTGIAQAFVGKLGSAGNAEWGRAFGNGFMFRVREVQGVGVTAVGMLTNDNLLVHIDSTGTVLNALQQNGLLNDPSQITAMPSGGPRPPTSLATAVTFFRLTPHKRFGSAM